MREALRALTRRGRLLAAVGLVALLAAWIGGQRVLLSLGVLLLALPLLSAFLVGRARYRLACARGLSPARLPVGDTATAVVRLENVSRLPSGVLLVEDEIPWELGPRPRFVLDRMESGGSRDVTYAVTSPVRGRWTLGPVAVRIVDPFGLCAVSRAFTATDTLVVTPAVHPLPQLASGGSWTGAGESRSAAVASSGEDDVVPREYRTGDDLRRVHWRATARAGELMVRREEQPWRARATLLLDERGGAHEGYGAGSSFEAAVTLVASIGVHLLRRSIDVRVVDGDGAEVVADGHAGDREGVLLDGLAVVDLTASTSVAAHAAALRRDLGDGMLVAVAGRLSLPDAERLARLRQGTATGLALLLDVDGWGGAGGAGVSAGTAAASALLSAAGWRTAVVRRGASPAEAWAALGAGGAVAGGTGTGGTGAATGGTAGGPPRVPAGMAADRAGAR